jgi:hypothetical protein
MKYFMVKEKLKTIMQDYKLLPDFNKTAKKVQHFTIGLCIVGGVLVISQQTIRYIYYS